MTETEKYLQKWIQDIYPGTSYTNALSLKWVAKFAEDYHARLKRIGEPRLLKKFYLMVDYQTYEIIEIMEVKLWNNRLRYPKVYNRGGSVKGLYYEIWAYDKLEALSEYDKFVNNER